MFNHNTLEQDILRLSREVKEKKAMPEMKDVGERGIVKQVIEPHIKKAVLQSAASGSTASDDDSVLTSYLKDAPTELKLEVEKLIDSVFHDGLGKAVKRARESGPFVLDAFHDSLADKLYDELKKRKLI